MCNQISCQKNKNKNNIKKIRQFIKKNNNKNKTNKKNKK